MSGLEALSGALRMETAGTGVRIPCIQPGLIATELQDRFDVHPRDMLGMKQPLEPADVARVVRFMLEQPTQVSMPRVMILPAEQPI
jgi:NADP-dependent 3-hydroxy acid dehydrogenase YdfG